MRIELLLILPLLMASGYREDPDEGQSQEQLQSQSQAQETQQTAEGGSVVLEQGDIDASSADAFTVTTDYKRNAPALYVPSISPTAPCVVTGGLGISLPGGGGSLGGGKLDKGCEERETARMLAEMGAGELALGILCNSKAVDRTIGKAACDAWILPMELMYVHAPVEEEQHQEEIVQQQQVQQQQSSQIAELLRLVEREKRARERREREKAEADQKWYDSLDELEASYEDK